MKTHVSVLLNIIKTLSCTHSTYECVNSTPTTEWNLKNASVNSCSFFILSLLKKNMISVEFFFFFFLSLSYLSMLKVKSHKRLFIGKRSKIIDWYKEKYNFISKEIRENLNAAYSLHQHTAKKIYRRRKTSLYAPQIRIELKCLFLFIYTIGMRSCMAPARLATLFYQGSDNAIT